MLDLPDLDDPVRLELLSMLVLMEKRHEIDEKIHERRQAVQQKLKLGVGASQQYRCGNYIVKVKHTLEGPYAYELSSVT